MKKIILLPFLAIMLVFTGYATSISEDDSQDQKNQKDEQGRKQGHWVYYGKDKSKLTEYAPEDIVEEGPYKDNRKHGLWKTYYPANKIKSEIEYKYNRPNGKVKKYYENGNVEEESIWTGRTYKDDFVLYHENGKVKQKKTFNAQGKTDGTVEYYNEAGNPELIYESTNGVNNGKLQRFWPNGDLKEEVVMNDGKADESTRVKKKRVNPPLQLAQEATKIAPDANDLQENEATKAGNGLHNVHKKLYNANGDLEQDGLFMNGKLYDGRLYKYDENGLLYKIEIYKKGKYFGDGVLEF